MEFSGCSPSLFLKIQLYAEDFYSLDMEVPLSFHLHSLLHTLASPEPNPNVGKGRVQLMSIDILRNRFLPYTNEKPPSSRTPFHYSMNSGTISAKSPWNTHSIKALYMTIINFRSITKDYYPLPP